MLNAWMRKITFLSFFVAALSCSSQETEVEEPVTDENTEEAANADEENGVAEVETNSAEATPVEPMENAVVTDESASPLPAHETSISPEFGAADAMASNATTRATPVVVETPMSDGSQLVMYVRQSGTSVYSQPDGSATFQLEKGDHILVTVEGNWARTPSGQFIKLNELTQLSTGRDRTGGEWK